MEDTLDEVVSKKSFDSLIRAVNTEKEKKASLQHTILKYVHLVFDVTFHCLDVRCPVEVSWYIEKEIQLIEALSFF